jgi:hypothetical protein
LCGLDLGFLLAPDVTRETEREGKGRERKGGRVIDKCGMSCGYIID